MKEKDNKPTVLEKISTQIVDKRNGFILIYLLLVIFCLFSRSWVSVNDDIKEYLPETTETRQGLSLMEEEFITFGTAQVMVSNITYDRASILRERIEAVEGIKSVSFDDSEDHFTKASALFVITVDWEETDPRSKASMDEVLSILSTYDTYVSSGITENMAVALEKEIKSVMIVAVFIILGVLLFTSKTYMEIPVLLVTFGVAAILNMEHIFYMVRYLSFLIQLP